MDAGPIWGYRTFALPAEPPRKAACTTAPVAEAAMELVQEVVAKAADRAFMPAPLDLRRPGGAWAAAAADAPGRPGRVLGGPDGDDRAADPGGRRGAGRPRHAGRGRRCRCSTSIAGRRSPGEPGAVVRRAEGAVLVRTGDGTVWIGHAAAAGRGRLKLPTARRWATVAGARGRGPARLPGDQLCRSEGSAC